MRIAAATGLTVALVQSSPPLPPPSRDGISKVFENDRLLVWQGVLGVKGEPTVMHSPNVM